MKAQTLVRASTGLNLPATTVERAVGQRMGLTGHADSEGYLRALTGEELTALLELLVVPESWFFRDRQAFRAAADFVLERLARAPRRAPLRILSLPCAGGEEPYSMAMALADAGVPADAASIDAVDLSPACIARARAGVYGRNAFRGADTAFRDRHFSPAGAGEYRIAEALRARVRFGQGNLLRLDGVASKCYDVVFCRNLLIYFDAPTTQAAIAILAALLADDGMLLAGYAEVPAFCQHGFAALPHKHAFALKKRRDAARPAMPPAARPAPPRPA
ncbi:protein-glutamate O-methyltransferase CheR, partial [Janthinobacterium sp.]|uniref:CheR family methyltransferase n=1 Tax=Janthinobacterium sp. TaxID=1871054 RepID=UPI00293D94D3